MTDDMVIRDARRDEAGFVAEMTRRMVHDLERIGGRTVVTSQAAWEKIAEGMGDEIGHDDFKYLVAETVTLERIGMAAAKIATLGGAFEPRKTVHLSIIYVSPTHRKAGVGGALIRRIMDWGRLAGAQYGTLNVLATNPARSLYETLGFSEFEFTMRKTL